MARRGKISEVFDLEAIEDQKKKVKLFIDDFVQSAEKFKPIKFALEGAQKPSEMIRGLKEFGAAMEHQNKVVREGVKAVDELNSIRRQYDKAIAEGKLAKQEYNKALKDEIQLEKAAEGSMVQKRIQLKQLQKAYDELSEAQRSSGEGDNLLKEIQAVDKQVKTLEGSTGRFQRSVGNYEGSVKILADALERARERQERYTNTLGAVSPEAQAARREVEALERTFENPGIIKVAANYGDATREMKVFTKELINLEQQGLGGSDFAIELRQRLSQLQDGISDARDEIKAMSSDTRALDQVASAVSFLASTYQTFVGVQELVGGENKEVQESLKKLMAVQAAATGIQQIAEQATKRGTIVNKAYTFTQGLLSTALDRTATSATRAQAALGLIGIAATVIGAVVIAYQMMSKAAESAATKQKVLSESLKEGSGEYAKAVKEVNELKINIDLAKQGMLSKEKVVHQYNETIGKTTGQVKTLDEAEKALVKNGEAYIQMTLMKAAANLALEKAAQKALEMAEERSKTEGRVQENADERLIKANAIASKDAEYIRLKQEHDKVFYAGEFDKAKQIASLMDARRKAVVDENLNPELKKQKDGLLSIAADFQKEAAVIANSFNFDLFGGKQDDKNSSKNKPTDITNDIRKNEEEKRKALFEARKRMIEDEIAGITEITENEKTSFKTRLLAAAALFGAKQRLVSEQKTFELAELKIKEDQEIEDAKKQEVSAQKKEEIVTAIKEKYTALRSNIDGAYDSQLVELTKNTTKQIEDLQKQSVEKIKADKEKAAATEFDRLQNNLSVELDNIQTRADDELAIEIKKFSKGEISKEEFERKKLAIETKARKESLEAEIIYYGQLINISNLAPDKKKDALEKLAEFEKQLRDEGLKSEEDTANKKWEINKKFYDKLKELGFELKDTISSLLSSGIENQLNELEEQIDLIDKRKEKEIEAINQSGATEEEKVNRISLAEKRAAVEKDQIERRQRQLNLEKARFERASQAAGIIGNTALAVTESLPNIPLSIVVGALGAAQLIKLLATPIPKYKDGTDYHKGGLAEVGDGGKHELVKEPDGSMWITDNKPTVVDLPKGTQVFPDAEKMLRYTIAMQHQKALSLPNVSKGEYEFKQMTKELGSKLDKLDRTIANKKEYHIEKPNYMKMWIKSGYSSQEFIDRLNNGQF